MEERIIKADPVGDPQGYQEELLALLGGSDPISVMAATAGTFAQQTQGVAADLLGRRPEPEEWSVAELLAHLFDAEIAYSFRARSILEGTDPWLIGYDQESWAALPHPRFPELLGGFAALRTANLSLARGTPESAWNRAGTHAERGLTTFRLLTETIAGHDRAHLAQLDQTLSAVRG